jgi:hypothetical protein
MLESRIVEWRIFGKPLQTLVAVWANVGSTPAAATFY